MIHVPITPEIAGWAKHKDEKNFSRFGNLGSDAPPGEGRRRMGFLAEAAIYSVFGSHLLWCNKQGYDFEWNGLTFDAKAKRASVPPKTWFDFTVLTEDAKKQVDYYIICTVLKNEESVWINGVIKKSDVLKLPVILKGSVNSNGNPIPSDRHLGHLSDLRPFKIEDYPWDLTKS